MLKLTKFPRGSNQNRPQKGRQQDIQDAEKALVLETRLIFARFWQDRDARAQAGPGGGQTPDGSAENAPEAGS